MSTKPKTRVPLSADDWVSHGGNGAVVSAAMPNAIANGQEAEKEPTARFTIDIPVSLHARIKSQCALKRVKMREEVLSMLEEKFPVV